jgi:hypothetical protein
VDADGAPEGAGSVVATRESKEAQDLRLFSIWGSNLNKLHMRLVRNDSGAIAHVEQARYCFLAVLAVVQSARIHVHPHEFVSHMRIKIAGELHGVGQSFIAMIKRILDAVAQCLGDSMNQAGAKVAPNSVPAEWKRPDDS